DLPSSSPLLLRIPYIGPMDKLPTDSVAAEIERRLRDALAPDSLVVVNDSDRHRGHAGHDGSGESHFTVDIVSGHFAGQGRLARQRAVNAALADLLRDRIHALAIRARAPGE